ncbi:hypothetical protein ES702_05569 [subsurface metagenome]
MPEDLEKRKARQKKYQQSKKGKVSKKRYLEKNQTEITQKRKAKEKRNRLGRLEAFCRHWELDVGIFQALEEMKEKGVDIWTRNPKYAKFIQIFQTGIYPEDMRVSITAKYRTVPGENQFSLPKQRQPAFNRGSARSSDYY